MNIFDTNDPTTIGMLIISVLIIAGVIGVNRLLRPSERALARNRQKGGIENADRLTDCTCAKTQILKTIFGGAPSCGTCPLSLYAAIDQNGRRMRQHRRPLGPNNRPSGTMETDRIKKASVDHSSAKTQLLAAEFSLSELFREFPDARDTFNPVTLCRVSRTSITQVQRRK